MRQHKEEPAEQLLGAQKLMKQLQDGMGASSGHEMLTQSDCRPNTKAEDATFSLIFSNTYVLSAYEPVLSLQKVNLIGRERRGERQKRFWR